MLNQFGGFEITKDEQNLLHVSNEYKDSNDIDNDEVKNELTRLLDIAQNNYYHDKTLDFEDVKILVNSGIKAAAIVPQEIMTESFHHKSGDISPIIT